MEVDRVSILQAVGNGSQVCQSTKQLTASGGLFRFRNPLRFSTPLLFIQLSAVSLASILIDMGLKPLGQSTIVSKILGGILFGPSFLSHQYILGSTLFPKRGSMIFNTLASFGLMFFLFSIGLKMDTRMMIRPQRHIIAIGISAIFVTMAFTVPLAFFLKYYTPMDNTLSDSILLLAGSQCLVPFPNIVVLLTELKLLNTDLGRTAVSAAMFCDFLGISLTALCFAIHTSTSGNLVEPFMGVVSTLTLIFTLIYGVRPLILHKTKLVPEGKKVGEGFVNTIFILVLVAGLGSEIVGQHFVLGTMVFGLVVPEGSLLGVTVLSKLEYPMVILYPTYLACSGLKTNIFAINLRSLWIMGLLVLSSCLVKIGALMVVGTYFNMPMADTFIIGLMLNARGICDIALYNIWKDSSIISEQEFSLSILSVVLVTAIITPLIRHLYDPSKQHMQTRRRTIQHAKRDSELRILVCIRNNENVPSLVNLLEASYASEESHIAVIAVILVELAGRSTPMLIAHQKERTLTPCDSRSGHIVNALHQYELHNETCATVQSFSSISHFATMHYDICRVALDQNVSIVIVPFHKQWAIDGSIGSTDRHMHDLNLKVLENAPCSVGIFIDRGTLTGSLSILSNQSTYNVATIYIGGVDDMECLAYAARMMKHESVNLTLFRFLLFGSNTRERKSDNELIDEIRYENSGNLRFTYHEEVVKDGVGVSSGLRELEEGFDLIMVGRQHQVSALMVGLEAWSECPEIGVIGDLLASPDFRSRASVLVVQQQRARGKLLNRATKAVVNDLDYDGGRNGAASASGGNSNSAWSKV